MSQRRRLVVVSHSARQSWTAGGRRTQEILGPLERTWDISLIAERQADPVVRRPSLLRRGANVATNLASDVLLLDRHEPWSARTFARWRPSADAALLLGWPFSAPLYAARRLAHHGIPYVVYASDPFALTPGASRTVRGIAAWRGARLERRLWRDAAGAIVTTPQQAAALERRFPSLPTLVRPSGYDPDSWDPAAVTPREPSDELRLVYFGQFWPQVHIESRWFFQCLLESGRWRSIAVAQYSGEATRDLLEPALPEAVHYRHHDALPWTQAARVAAGYDLALAISPRRGVQLPRKVIDYQTLPIPRVALVEPSADGAISSYLAGRGGWALAGGADPDLPHRIDEHATRARTVEDLAPPPEEAWPRVAETIAGFVADRLRPSSA